MPKKKMSEPTTTAPKKRKATIMAESSETQPSGAPLKKPSAGHAAFRSPGAALLAKVMEERGLSCIGAARKMAEKTGGKVTRVNVWQWRDGGVKPSLDNVLRIKEVFGIPPMVWAAANK